MKCDPTCLVSLQRVKHSKHTARLRVHWLVPISLHVPLQGTLVFTGLAHLPISIAGAYRSLFAAAWSSAFGMYFNALERTRRARTERLEGRRKNRPAHRHEFLYEYFLLIYC